MTRSTSALLGIVAACFALQFSLAAFTFPISELLSDKPFLHIDSPYHEYQIYLAEQFGKQGLLRGYDPFFSAGYVGGITHNFSFRVPALIAAFLAPDTNPFVVYKIYYLFSACAAVVMLPIAAYALGLGTRVSAISGLIGILLWWNSEIRGAYNSGLLSSIFSAFAATAFAAIFLAALRTRITVARSIGVALIGALGFLYHPFFPILAAFIVLPGVVVLRAEYRLGAAMSYALTAAVIGLAANSFWIIPTLADRQLADVNSSYSSTVVPFAIINEMFGRTTILNGAIVACALYGFAFVRHPKIRAITSIFIVAGFAMMVYGGLGAAIPQLAKLQPNRFLPFAFVVMIPAAAVAIRQMLSDLKNIGLRKTVAAAALIGVSLVTLNALRETRQEITYLPGPRRGLMPPEIRGEGPATTWLREWIQNNTFGDGRILFEHTGKTVYDRSYVSSYLGLQTKREFANYGFPLDSPTGFGHGRLFGKAVDEYNARELCDLLQTYNVGWVITAEDKTTDAFKALPNVRVVADRGDLHIFQVDNAPGLFLKGTGKVTDRSINKLTLDDLSGPDVVIRYHYVDCLRSSPPVSIKPVSISGARYPFVELVNPPGRVTLRCFNADQNK